MESSRVRFIVQWLPAILGFIGTFLGLASQVGYVTTSLLAGFVALLLRIASNRFVEKAMPQPVVSPGTKPPTETLHPVCDVGPYKVEAGDNRSMLVNAKQGQRVKGHLEEVDGQRDEFTDILWGYDKKAYRVNRKIPVRGTVVSDPGRVRETIQSQGPS